MKKVAVIGHGYVGTSVEKFFADHFELEIFDPKYKTDVENPDSLYDFVDLDKKKALVNMADLAVVCVPTPEAENHSVDLSIIEDVLSWIEAPLILIKSTIPPGTTDALKAKYGKRIVFSPEYIGEGKYEVQWWKDKNYPHPTDMKKHNFQIFGGDKADCIEISAFFQKVVGPEPEMCFTDAKTAELCKYMENSWGATKVTFCNEFANIAKAMGVEYPELRELWLKDGRVERMHTAVFPDNRGFGGKCYPKDVNGIVEHSKANGYEPKLLATVLSVNDEIRAEQKNG
jgi:UDPglucose 6-dehydrogenase